MANGKTILAVGSIAIDTLQTPAGSRSDVLGGSVLYFSIAAGLLTNIKIVGVVGNDFPEAGWQTIKSRGINVDNIQVLPGTTFRWGGKYNSDYSSRDTLFTDLGVFESFLPKIKDDDCYSPIVYLGNIQPELQIRVANMVYNSECVACDTMNLWIDLYSEKLHDVLKKSTIVFINHEEAEQFTGKLDVASAAKILHSAGPRVVVIKMGANGAYLSHRNKTAFIPAFPVERVLDPTGAGDTFAGGFMGCLAQAKKPDFVAAVIAGSAMASFCVEGFGLDSLFVCYLRHA